MSRLKTLIPPAFISWLLSSSLYPYGFKGQFKSWQEASTLASGYDNETIFKHVLTSTLSVINEEKAFDRDSVTFDKLECNWPLISTLLYAYTLPENKETPLKVLDFGGALGSSYLQNRLFIEHIINTWHIVEQAPLIELAHEHIHLPKLKFHKNINDLAALNSQIILFSCVLQYIENFQDILANAFELQPSMIFVERMSISKKSTQYICLQKVNKKIYPASYPCWVLPETTLLNIFERNGYSCIHDYVSPIDNQLTNIEFKSYVFKRI